VGLHGDRELGGGLVPAIGQRLLEVGSRSCGAGALMLVTASRLFATGVASRSALSRISSACARAASTILAASASALFRVSAA